MIKDYAMEPEANAFPASRAPVLWSYLAPVECEVRIGKQVSPKKRYAVGDFRLVTPGTEIRRVPSAATVIRAITLPFRPFAEYVAPRENSSAEALLNLQKDTFRSNSIDFLTQNLARSEQEGAPDFFVESLAHAIVLELWRLTAAEVGLDGFAAPSDQICARTLALIDQYILDSLEDKIDLEKLANVAGMQVFAFSRAFKNATGRSPYQHVLNLRIAQARALVITSKLSLAEIAYRCGFSSQSHMTDAFTSRLGVSPGRIRKT